MKRSCQGEIFVYQKKIMVNVVIKKDTTLVLGIIQNSSLNTWYEINLNQMLQSLANEKSTLVMSVDSAVNNFNEGIT